MNIVLFSQNDNFFFKRDDPRTVHIQTILKKTVGDFFEAGIENGSSGVAKITSVNDKGLSFSFEQTGDGKPLFPIEMIIGFVRPIQLKRLFRDMASMGACRIHLVGTDLGEKSYMSSNIVQRGTAHQALRDGTIQAKSTHIPTLIIHENVTSCLDSLSFAEKSTKICLDNVQPKQTLFEHLTQKNITKNQTVYAAIGSERGWSNTERLLFEQNNFSLCSIGNRVLRTETAATVALSIVLQSMGEL